MSAQAAGDTAADVKRGSSAVPTNHCDVLIVGAGLSGIGAAYHLQAQAPERSYIILEGRAAKGGTWDLFRYPGIRSDSDMYTLGYSFQPWREPEAIAGGASILRYLEEVARDHAIEPRIRYNHQVKRAAWDSRAARWTVEVARTDTGETVSFTCSFLFMCTGYYDYATGHDPDFPGRAEFQGRIVHPQFWPEDLDYRGKRVVVIGSGATAVTIVPEMAREAAHVVMLQRSPTYMVSRPSRDRIANALRRILPARSAYRLVRWKNVLLQLLFFQLARRKPAEVRRRLLQELRNELGPDYDIATHFTPSYNPWDQRLCLVPDSDLFRAIRGGTASVVTDDTERFTSGGILLRSGCLLEADVIVTATGLKLQLLSDVQFTLDGEVRDLSRCIAYKGMMFDDVPNLAYSFGYTNASWTLKADLTASYVCRLLNHMAKTGTDICVPRRQAGVREVPLLDFTSGYVQRSLHILPKQGDRAPWRVHQNYPRDLAALKWGRLEDGVMEFRRSGAGRPSEHVA